MESEWEKEKEKILNSLLGAGQEALEFPSEPEVGLLRDGRCLLPIQGFSIWVVGSTSLA